MRGARAAILMVSALALLGCEDDEPMAWNAPTAPARPEEPGALSSSGDEERAGRTETRTGAMGATTARPSPTGGEAGGAASERSGEQPGGAAIMGALRAEGTEAAALLGRPQPVGDGRFLVVATSGGDRPSLTFAVVGDDDGARIEATLPLELEEEVDAMNEPPNVAARDVDDLDGDGEREAMALVRYMTPPERAVGPAEIGHYFLFDLDPEPSIAFSEQTQRSQASMELRGHVTLEDGDGDGHPDVHIRYTDCIAGEQPECERREAVHLYDPDTDRWSAEAE